MDTGRRAESSANALPSRCGQANQSPSRFPSPSSSSTATGGLPHFVNNGSRYSDIETKTISPNPVRIRDANLQSHPKIPRKTQKPHLTMTLHQRHSRNLPLLPPHQPSRPPSRPRRAGLPTPIPTSLFAALQTPAIRPFLRRQQLHHLESRAR